jgi:NitT/TauT family transport system ATP-binding protein
VRVELQGVGFSYPSSGPVLDGLDLTVADGACHSVIGPSGCGKTTLLRLIGGLERPSSGTVEFSGVRTRANLTAMVFQTPRLLPWWDIGRNVAIGQEFAGTPEGVYDRVKSLYTSLVGLGRFIGRLPHTLSRGQQSRAGLGRALAHDADVLLMDEPFAHLDYPSRRRVMAELESIWMATPRTAVFVTHDVEEAVLLGDRVTVMTRSGAILDTVEVDVPRPRFSLDPTDTRVRAAIGRLWQLLEEGS